MMELSLAALLLTNTDLVSLIGIRLYPLLLPETPTYPAVTYQVVSSESQQALDGAETIIKTMQFDAWGTNYKEAKAVEAALRQALLSYQGPLSDGSIITGVFAGVAFDEFSPGTRKYRQISEFQVHYRAA